MMKQLNKSKLSRVICLLLVFPFLVPANLPAKHKPQVTVEKIGGEIVQGDLIHVSIMDEVLLIKKPEDLAGVKVPVEDIVSVRIRGKINAGDRALNGLFKGFIGLLVGASIGILGGHIVESRESREETLIPMSAFFGAILGTAGFFSGLIGGASKSYRYKTFEMKGLHGDKYLGKR
ncbi:MAG: hypothetical protein GY940_04475, partial [bacterium]|nr:hypothetical protein [bacterium]